MIIFLATFCVGKLMAAEFEVSPNYRARVGGWLQPSSATASLNERESPVIIHHKDGSFDEVRRQLMYENTCFLGPQLVRGKPRKLVNLKQFLPEERPDDALRQKLERCINYVVNNHPHLISHYIEDGDSVVEPKRECLQKLLQAFVSDMARPHEPSCGRKKLHADKQAAFYCELIRKYLMFYNTPHFNKVVDITLYDEVSRLRGKPVRMLDILISNYQNARLREDYYSENIRRLNKRYKNKHFHRFIRVITFGLARRAKKVSHEKKLALLLKIYPVWFDFGRTAKEGVIDPVEQRGTFLNLVFSTPYQRLRCSQLNQVF